MATSTPWGMSHSKTKYARGINFYSCAGHGGIILSAGMNAKVPEYARNPNRAYEEDIDWAIVVTFFPEHFNTKMREDAFSTVKNWLPEIWERRYGVELKPGESYIKDRNAEEERNSHKYTVTSAWGDWQNNVPKGMVGVSATKRATGEAKFFLVANEEYEKRIPMNGFVIDEERHSVWAGPDAVLVA